jgi:hypothetical protein
MSVVARVGPGHGQVLAVRLLAQMVPLASGRNTCLFLTSQLKPSGRSDSWTHKNAAARRFSRVDSRRPHTCAVTCQLTYCNAYHIPAASGPQPAGCTGTPACMHYPTYGRPSGGSVRRVLSASCTSTKMQFHSVGARAARPGTAVNLM